MTWIEVVEKWRQLPAETKLRIRLEAIPDDVAQSMAFEGEPVPMETIRAAFARIKPPFSPRDAETEKPPSPL